MLIMPQIIANILIYLPVIGFVVFLCYSFVYKPRIAKWLKLNGTCVSSRIIKIKNPFGKDILEMYAHEKNAKNFDICKFCTKTMQDRQSDVPGYCAEVFCSSYLRGRLSE